ncbi:hypothetical protein BDY21DRAFT_39211 [Lineolata rhizophorae]|uniref:Uncharacterized protein n=1 Tax=Lineolata rhizophorae TaxID=578093 RepID=A0A6A6P053_9PEZI|nr:hypothetical protein BDY21DRAFT_39211 [Lineolata rhizophorae]
MKEKEEFALGRIACFAFCRSCVCTWLFFEAFWPPLARTRAQCCGECHSFGSCTGSRRVRNVAPVLKGNRVRPHTACSSRLARELLDPGTFFRASNRCNILSLLFFSLRYRVPEKKSESAQSSASGSVLPGVTRLVRLAFADPQPQKHSVMGHSIPFFLI